MRHGLQPMQRRQHGLPEKIDPHTHKGEKEICYILEGQGLYTDNDRQIPVKAGDVTVDSERHGCSTTDRKT